MLLSDDHPARLAVRKMAVVPRYHGQLAAYIYLLEGHVFVCAGGYHYSIPAATLFQAVYAGKEGKLYFVTEQGKVWCKELAVGNLIVDNSIYQLTILKDESKWWTVPYPFEVYSLTPEGYYTPLGNFRPLRKIEITLPVNTSGYYLKGAKIYGGYNTLVSPYYRVVTDFLYFRGFLTYLANDDLIYGNSRNWNCTRTLETHEETLESQVHRSNSSR